jgi:hypothetical protein
MNKKIFALTLGDGCIDNKTSLHIRHCTEQKEYLIWKHSYLIDNIPCSEIVEGQQNGYGFLKFHTKTDNKEWREQIKEVKGLLYSHENKKYFSKEVIDLLTLEDFAILYMDDGSLTAKKRNGIIHAYDLTISLYCSKEECERFIEKLNEFGLKFTLKLNKGLYSIRCGTKSARKFIELIKPYCPKLDCFKNTKFKEIITDSSYLISKFKQ